MIEAPGPGTRERRLVSAILVLGTIVLFFAAVSMAGAAIGFFGDTLLTFFLAWLLAFIISPVVTRIVALIPRLPRVLATVLVYSVIVALLVFIVLVIAQALSTSITQFAGSIPQLRGDITTIVAPLQGWLDGIGLGQVDVATQALAIIDNLDVVAGQLIVPLQSIALATVGALGT
jgi:predicted PurR-regulated permease PerM